MHDIIHELAAQPFQAALLVLAFGTLLLLIVTHLGRTRDALDTRRAVAELAGRFDRFETLVRDESAAARRETALAARDAREEAQASAGRTAEALLGRLSETARFQADQLEGFARQLAQLTSLNETKL